MEQFKSLPLEQRYQYAYNWLVGYFEAASETARGFPQTSLRTLLDRMERFADVKLGATFDVDASKPLDLATDSPNEYHYAWLVLIGYLEAAHWYRSRGLKQRELWEILDKMEKFTGANPVPHPRS